MRATPLSVWAHKLSTAKIEEVTKYDVNLTHSHQACVVAVSAYNVAIAHLINNLGDRKGAIEAVAKYLKESGDADVKEWFEEAMNAKDESEMISASPHKIGWIRIAFTFSFYFLKQGYSFEKTIEVMLW